MNEFGVGLAEIGTHPVFKKLQEKIYQHCCPDCRYEFKSNQVFSTCIICGADTSSDIESMKARPGVLAEIAYG